MPETALLEEIRDDLNFLKERITVIEISISEIDADLHRQLSKEYSKKLDKIEKEDKRVHFKNIEEFDRHFGL